MFSPLYQTCLQAHLSASQYLTIQIVSELRFLALVLLIAIAYYLQTIRRYKRDAK